MRDRLTRLAAAGSIVSVPTVVEDGWIQPQIPSGGYPARMRRSEGHPGDLLIPVVFPDYRVRLPGGGRDGNRLALGHAGIVLIDGETHRGLYYEWGRYDAGRDMGMVRMSPAPRIELREVARIRQSDLSRLLGWLSTHFGEHTRVQAVLTPSDRRGFELAQGFANQRMRNFRRGTDPRDTWCAAPGLCFQSPLVDENERIYTIGGNSCLRFACRVAEVGSGLTNMITIWPTTWARHNQRFVGLTRADYDRRLGLRLDPD